MSEPAELKAMVDAFATNDDIKARRIKAHRILSILKKNHIDPENSSCLEIGTGSGVISDIFQKKFSKFLSIDVNDICLREYRGSSFVLYDGRNIPATDNYFDAIVCTQVYQYVHEKNEFINEVARVLRPGGKVYFTTSNRFALIEPHFKLPFLGYLPHTLANIYMRMMGKGESYSIKSESYSMLTERVSEYLDIDDITVEVIKNHEEYEVTDLRALRFIAYVPGCVLKIFEKFIFPTWVFILTKKS